MITYCRNPNCTRKDKPIIWFCGRPPHYHDDNCRMEAYRYRKRNEQLAQLHVRWQYYCPYAREILKALYERHGFRAALLATEAFEAELSAISGWQKESQKM